MDKRKRLTIVSLIILILGLSGLAIFISVTLQQNQAPIDSSAAVRCVLGSPPTCQKNINNNNNGYKCTCVALGTGNTDYRCNDYDPGYCPPATSNLCPQGSNYAGACGTDGCASGQKPSYGCIIATDGQTSNYVKTGCVADSSCAVVIIPDPVVPSPGNQCVITYNGSSISFSTACSGELQYFHSPYDGVTRRCPTTENGEARFNLAAGVGGSYSANPAPGECRQFDHHFGGKGLNGSTVGPGGVCDCTPPTIITPPPISPTITCYRCTTQTNDANACEQFQIEANACPVGSTASSNCASQVSCPVTTLPPLTPPTVSSVCPSGSTSPVINIAWTSSIYNLDINTSSTFTGSYWNKVVNGLQSTQAPSGFTPVGNGGTLVLQSATTYFVRGYSSTTNQITSIVSITTASCVVSEVPPPTVSSVCPAGATNPVATISWSKLALNLDLDNQEINPTGGFWFKDVSGITSGFSTEAPIGFVPVQGASGTLVLQNATKYFVRANYFDGGLSAETEFTTANCELPPGQLPDTGIFDEASYRVMLGLLMIVLGIIVYKFDILSKINIYLYVAKNLDISEEVKVREHLNKVQSLKKSRKSYENKVDKYFNRKEPR